MKTEPVEMNDKEILQFYDEEFFRHSSRKHTFNYVESLDKEIREFKLIELKSG